MISVEKMAPTEKTLALTCNGKNQKGEVIEVLVFEHEDCVVLLPWNMLTEREYKPTILTIDEFLSLPLSKIQRTFAILHHCGWTPVVD